MSGAVAMPGVSFLLLAGGRGERTALGVPKQFHPVLGRPMMAYPLIAAEACIGVNEIIVNAAEGTEAQTRAILETYVKSKPARIVAAGETRQHSARLLAEAARAEVVILAEGARPMIDAARIEALIASPHANVGYCAPIPFALCEADPATGEMLRNIDRARAFNIQLPQKFRKADLLAAHRKAHATGAVYNEDAMLCREQGGFSVHMLEGWPGNIKVTTAEDFIFVEELLRRAGVTPA